jgi:4-aminobutyrate aminotransferase-like enzyme
MNTYADVTRRECIASTWTYCDIRVYIVASQGSRLEDKEGKTMWLDRETSYFTANFGADEVIQITETSDRFSDFPPHSAT